MEKKLIARTAKLSSETKKARRAKGIAVSYEHISKDLEERSHGSIYAVININAPIKKAEEIAELIIDAFHGEYYSDLAKSPLESFESALYRVNEELAEATQQGNGEWLNNLNALLVVLKDTTIYFTQAGKVDAFLYRNDKPTLVSDSPTGDITNPLRTFAYTKSGDLQEGDKVALVTHDVFFYISKEDLRKFVSEFHPAVAIEHIASLLENISHEVKPNAVLILEMITPQAASEEIVSSPSDVWIAEPTKPVQEAIEVTSPFIKSAIKAIKKYWSLTLIFLTNKFFPKVKILSKDIYSKIREKLKKLKANKPTKQKDGNGVLYDTSESISNKDFYKDYEENIETHESALKPQVESFDEPIRTKAKAQDLYIRETKDKPKWLQLERFNFSGFKNTIKKSNKTNKGKKSIIIFALLLLVLGTVGTFVLFRSNAEEKNKEIAQTSLNEILTDFDTGKNLIANDDRTQAISILNEVKTSAEKLKDNKYVGTDAIALIASVNNALDQAEKITRISSDIFADIKEITGADSFGPFLVDSNLYTINRENGTIAAINIANSEVSTVLDSPSIDGKIISANPVLARSVIVLFSDAGSIYEFDTVDLKISKQTTSEDVEKANDVASFSTNIYSLDSTNGKIYKRQRSGSGYGTRTEYITDGTSVANATSIAIDSNIYTLDSNGTIKMFLVGKKQEFSITGLLSEINNANYLFTDEDLDYIFFADTSNGRIIRLDKNGKFVDQFASNNFTNINGLTVDGTNKVIYAASEGKIYKISY